jgi:hypothetical protein
MFDACMLRDRLLLFWWATGKDLADPRRERSDVFGIELLTPVRCAFAGNPADIFIRQAFLFGTDERRFVDEQAQALVTAT